MNKDMTQSVVIQSSKLVAAAQVGKIEAYGSINGDMSPCEMASPSPIKVENPIAPPIRTSQALTSFDDIVNCDRSENIFDQSGQFKTKFPQ